MAQMSTFNGDAFSLVEMTDAIENMEYQPTLLRDLKVFEKQPIRTTQVQMESKQGKLTLVPISERGSPLTQAEKKGRDIRSHPTMRLAKQDVLQASEIQNIRAFGKSSELQEVKKEVRDRIMSLQSDLELTEENMRLGAIQGKIIDADGTEVVDWFNYWGITPPAEYDFDLANATDDAIVVMIKDMKRAMLKGAKGAAVGKMQIIALAGDDFYDTLANKEVVKGNTITPQEAQRISEQFGDVYDSFKFQGIVWINYRGTDDDTVGIASGKVKFFPIGVKGMFKHALSPGESFEFVNTPGKDRYALTIPDEKRNAYVELELYTYPLFYPTRMLMLQSGKA